MIGTYTRRWLTICALLLAWPGTALAVQVIAQDLEVQGSTCIGADCSGAEVFDFDTLRFRENNLRIKFDDTSSTSDFPNFDWEIVVNESADGGLNMFAIQDDTSATVPFTLLGGAPSNSFYMDALGQVGLGTSSPAATLDVAGTLNVLGGASALSLDVTGVVKASGLSVSGLIAGSALSITGLVNGRDVAADGAVLDALAAAADVAGSPKAGIIPIAEFSKVNPKATVTFATPYDPSDSYVVMFTLVGKAGKASPSLVSQDENGFTVSLGTRRAGKVTAVQWLAQLVTE